MERRVERMLAVCVDVSFGTVWRVREDLWRDSFRQSGQRYDERGTRRWHPGLSMRNQPPVSLHEFVPMLFGTTGDRGPVVVRGLSRELGPTHPAEFGRILRPAPFALREFVSPAVDAPRNQLFGHWFDRMRIERNSYKPKLDGTELASLQTWAKDRGLL